MRRLLRPRRERPRDSTAKTRDERAPLHSITSSARGKQCRIALFASNVRSLDDRSPFLNLGLVKRKQGFRSLLITWPNLLS
jgi:hypothetical protein